MKGIHREKTLAGIYKIFLQGSFQLGLGDLFLINEILRHCCLTVSMQVVAYIHNFQNIIDMKKDESHLPRSFVRPKSKI